MMWKCRDGALKADRTRVRACARRAFRGADTTRGSLRPTAPLGEAEQVPATDVAVDELLVAVTICRWDGCDQASGSNPRRAASRASARTTAALASARGSTGRQRVPERPRGEAGEEERLWILQRIERLDPDPAGPSRRATQQRSDRASSPSAITQPRIAAANPPSGTSGRRIKRASVSA